MSDAVADLREHANDDDVVDTGVSCDGSWQRRGFKRCLCCNINGSMSLDNLKFGVYDAVANFNIGMKATVLVFEKLNMLPGAFMLR